MFVKVRALVLSLPSDGSKLIDDVDSMALQTLEKKVFELLATHGEGKPVLIFCPTRKIVESCADQLFKDMEEAGEKRSRMPWRKTKALMGSFSDKKLQSSSFQACLSRTWSD